MREGINIIILSDRRAGADSIPMPSLLACAAVHHHLIRQGLRTSVGLVVESGEPREVHHFCCLAGYGAEAINPYLAFETLRAMKDDLPQKLDEKEIVKRYIKSIDKGLLKVMSKMGISTYQSYCGAQIFDAVGLKSDFVAEYFTGTATRIEGVALDRDRRGDGAPPSRRLRRRADLSRCARRRRRISVSRARRGPCLDRGHGRRRCSTRCAAISPDQYRAFAKVSNEQSEQLLTIRGLFRLKSARRGRPQAGADRGGRAGEATSCGASPPAPCRSARSRARRTPRSPSP